MPDKNAALRSMLETAFPGEPWDDERIAAFKEAKRLCEESYDEEEAVEGEVPADEGLGLVFGGPAME